VTNSDSPIIVIGAGIAGLLAARLLAQAGQPVLVLEARQRLGGRIYSDHDFAGGLIERGAEFVHGHQSLTWQLIRALGLATAQVNAPDDTLIRLLDGAALCINFDSNHLPDLRGLTPQAWSDPSPQDEALDGYLLRMGVKPAQLEYEPRIFAIDNGGPLSDTSALATLQELDDESTGVGDFVLLGGYDQLPQALAKGLAIRLGAVVEQLDWATTPVRLTLASGEVLEAAQVIITVPLGVLKARAIGFRPDLPAERWQAIDAVAFAPMFKLIYRFATPVLPPGITNLYTRANPPLFWTTSPLHNEQQQSVTAFLTGDWARAMLGIGDQTKHELALAILRGELGQPTLQPLAVTIENWSEDRYSQGGYSYTPPAALAARQKLAEPLPEPLAHDGQQRLFFAGEATARPAAQGSVHGALESGLRVVGQVLGQPLDQVLAGGFAELLAVLTQQSKNTAK
jgi:monoamine oxidase